MGLPRIESNIERSSFTQCLKLITRHKSKQKRSSLKKKERKGLKNVGLGNLDNASTSSSFK